MTARRRSEAHSHMIGDLFTFALFAMFLLLSLLIVVIGVDVYRGVVDAGDSVGGVRTTLGYVAGKVRSEQAKDGIRVETKNGIEALVLTEMYDDTPYETAIYHVDGALYESYYDGSLLEFDPEYGERLTEIENFDVGITDDGLLLVSATAADGRSQSMHLALRGGQEVIAP